jgi:hypothetical protein
VTLIKFEKEKVMRTRNRTTKLSAKVVAPAALLAWVLATLLPAAVQAQSPPPRVAVERDQVTITSQEVTQQFRVEVFSPGGEQVFDSGFVAGQPVSWDMKDSQERLVPEGVYVVLLSATNANGKVRKMIEQVIVWRKSVEKSAKAQADAQPSAVADQPTPKAIQDSAGTPGKIAKWIAADTLGDSVITEDASKIGITSLTPMATLHVDSPQPRISLADGTNAGTLLQTSGGKGGDANGSATGGEGADISLLAGNGGDAPLGTSGGGGNITIQAGSPGTGPTLGQTGRVLIAPFVGRVGIGTVSPNEKLTVEGNIQINGNGNGLKFSDNTVQTSAGMTAVATNATLAGDGTAGAPLGVPDQGIDTVQLKDGGVTDQKIAAGQVVKSLNTLKDDVTLAEGDNITITPNGNTLTIAATSQGLNSVSHNATLNGDGTNANPLAVSVPLSLSGSSNGGILSVTNGGTGPAITTAGAINTNSHYSIGGSRVLSVAGMNNLFAGVSAGANIAEFGSRNAFVGNEAGEFNTVGSDNSFFGFQAGKNNLHDFNSFFGSQTGRDNTEGTGNSFFGAEAGRSNTTGSSNAFFGMFAGRFNVTGSTNSFFGAGAGNENTEGGGNTFVGSGAGSANTTADSNSFFGRSAGQSNTTANLNSFFGHQAGWKNTTGDTNSFFGEQAGRDNLTGLGNTFLGYHAGFFNSSGNRNVFVGRDTGITNTTGQNNTFIGASSDGAAGLSNATAIGFRAKVEQNNSLVLGSISGVNGANATAQVGIGTTTPQARLQVNQGDIYIGSPGQGIILKSPNGNTCRKMTINNAGNPVSTAVPCP